MRDRKRRSEPMTPEEHEAFKSLYGSFPTKVDAEIHFSLSRQVLDVIAIKGSGSPDSIKKIRKHLKKLQAA